MKTLCTLFTLALIVTLFYSCDKISGPYIEGIAPDTTDTNSNVVKRKSLLLDFTGHKCINCPRAHRAIAQITSLYHENVIPVSIHCNYYAIPSAPPATKYTYDFTTNVGYYFGGDGNYMGIFDIIGTPAGMVNSLKKEDCTTDYSSWANLVAAVYNTNALLKIELTSSLSNNNQDAAVTIRTTAMESLNRNLRIVAFVIEDSIVNWQKDADAVPQDVEFYTHRHVLRKALNGVWAQGNLLIGDELKSGAFNKDELVTKTYSFSIAGTDWVASKVRVVAFVFDNDTKEILQAEECEPF